MNPSETTNNDCIFCRIAAGTIPAEVVYEDAGSLAFQDTHPKAPVHILIIPRKHIASINAVQAEDEALLGHLFSVARRVAQDQRLTERGYRLMINTGDEGGQTVYHLHLHLLGGKHLGRY